MVSYTYPISLPSSPAPSAIRSRPMASVAVSVSNYTQAEHRQAYDGQRLVWEIDLPPIQGNVTSGEWEAAFLKLNGRQGSCLFGDPSRTSPEGNYDSGSDTPLVDGTASPQEALEGDLVLPTKGWRNNGTALLLPGDWIQLGSGSTTNLHKVLTQVDSDGSGNADIDIWPRLRRTLSDGDALTLSSPEGRWRLDSNTMPQDLAVGLIYGFSFTLVEDFS